MASIASKRYAANLEEKKQEEEEEDNDEGIEEPIDGTIISGMKLEPNDIDFGSTILRVNSQR